MTDTKVLHEDGVDISVGAGLPCPIVEGGETLPLPNIGQQRDIKPIVEAILFAANEPVSIRKLCEIIGNTDAKQIREIIESLRQDYDSQNRAFQIEDIADGFQILTRAEYYDWVAKLWKKSGDNKLSQAALETLSIIAYKQPITRADIEAIRGVQSGQMIRTLIEKKLVKVVGREEVLGRPLLYGTTKSFLEQFGLKSIKDLPKTKELDIQ